MIERLLEIRQQRGALLARIDIQRGQLAEVAAKWERPLALADRGVSIFRLLLAHPILVGGVVSFAVLRRRGVTGVLKTAWRVWKAYGLLADLRRKL